MRPKLSIRDIADRVTGDARRCLVDLVYFEALFKLSTALVVVPAATWTLHWVVVGSGDQAIGNFDILAFVLTKRGMLGAIATLLISLAIVFAEVAGLLFIGYGAAEGRQVTYVDALRMIGRRLSWIFKAAFLGLFAAVVAIAPFLSGLLLVYNRFLSRYDINYYLAVRPPELRTALWLGGVLIVPAAIVALIVYFIANYALPGILFRERSVRSAYRLSLRLMRRQGLLLVAPLFAWLAAWFALTTVMNWIGYQLAVLLVAAAGENQAALIGVLGFILALDLFAIVAFNFVLVTVNALLTVRLFREACRRASIPLDPVDTGVPRDDRRRRRLPRKWIATGAFIALLLGVASVWGLLETEELAESVKISAHRGSSLTAPENTLAAVRQAVEDRADYVEIDVQLTRDDVVVVAHDADLMRLAGDPRVITRSTYDELREVDLGSWFGSEFAEERIPTLEEVIETVRGRAKLLVEIKSHGADGARLVAEVVEILRAHAMEGSAAIMSLVYEEVREARRLAPEIPAGFAASATIGRVARIDADFLALSLSMATGSQIASAHRQGKQVWVWTVDDPAQMSRLIELGADNIITNTPATMHQVLEERAELTPVERLLLRFRHVFID